MLSKKIQDAINEQINAELWSAYLYLSMATFCHDKGMSGTANWFEVQFKEEQDHAKILYNHIISRNGRVLLKPIVAVPDKWKSILHAFEESLAHEKEVTAMIDNLYTLSAKEKDYAAQSMLHWFIDEQVEEEESVQTIIDHLKLIKDSGNGLYMFDRELGGRVYKMASPLAK